MSEPFKIRYDKNRFPIRQKRPDGKYGCRGCGGEIPKGRRSWCSRACAKKFDPTYVLSAVRARDNEVCSHCGLDCRKAHNDYMRSKSSMPWTEWKKLCPPIAEYDHIIPFSEGGLTVLENIRTLCTVCHKKRTAEWAAFKARQRRAAARQQVEMTFE